MNISDKNINLYSVRITITKNGNIILIRQRSNSAMLMYDKSNLKEVSIAEWKELKSVAILFTFL